MTSSGFLQDVRLLVLAGLKRELAVKERKTSVCDASPWFPSIFTVMLPSVCSKPTVGKSF